MDHTTADRPALLLAMGPGIAERLFTDRHLDRLTALTRTDPRRIAHDLTAPEPALAAALGGVLGAVVFRRNLWGVLVVGASFYYLTRTLTG